MKTAATILVLCLLLATSCNSLSGDRETQRADALASQQMSEILSRIVPPKFPSHDFPITSFGALADGKTDNGPAIAKAIEACHNAGGGRVVVPAGEFVTGPIHLLSEVNLHLDDRATLRFDPTPAKYLPLVLTRFEGVECMNYSPLIYAYGQENIAITGSGTLDGSATSENWLGWKKDKDNAEQRPARDKLFEMGQTGVPVEQRVFGDGGYLRPNFIQPYRCKNVLIEDVHIIRSPMWEIHPTLSTNVTVRGVKINSLGMNNDGCDPESSRDVLIENCTFATGDDCIAIKSGRNNDGRRVGVPSENLIIRNCNFADGHGGVTIGSEISGDCRNVFVENCKMDSPNLHVAFRFKSNAQRGGVIQNVHIHNVQIGRVAMAVFSIELDYEEGAKGPLKPVIDDIYVDHVTSESSKEAVHIAGFPTAEIKNINLSDCTFKGVESPDMIKDAAAPKETNVRVMMSK